MLLCAGFAEPALATAVALPADFGGKVLTASLAHDLGLLVAGQQLHLALGRALLPQSDYFQPQFRGGAIVVHVGKLQPGFQYPIEAHWDALFGR